MMEIYVDASYDPKSGVAICGWMNINNNLIQTCTITNTKNTEAEIMGIIKVMKLYENVDSIIIYTDCQTIVNLVDKRRYNKEIYANFYELFDKYNGKCQFIKVAGHKNKNLRTDVENNFSKLDKYVRHTLRNYLNNSSIVVN